MKTYDFGDGWKATIEKTSSGYYIVVMDIPSGKYETVHRDEQDAMREILSYFETGASNVIEAEEKIIHYINKIPSTHDRNSGKWICTSIIPGVWTDTYECSECKKLILSCKLDLLNFCPECGADMREPGKRRQNEDNEGTT